MRTHVLRSLAIFEGFLWGVGLLPPTNEVCEGYDFTPVCHSVHRGVSRPRPRGEVGGTGGGCLYPDTGGRLGVWWGDVQARTWVRGCPGPGPGGPGPALGGGGVSKHALRQTPPSRQLLLRVVRILLECIVVHCATKS